MTGPGPLPASRVPAGADVTPTISDIQRVVAEHFGTLLIDMTSRRRGQRVSKPRQVAMYLAREMTVLSLPEIGRHFGDRDHTTVAHACRVIADLVAADPGLADAIADLRQRLSNLEQAVLPLAAKPEA